MKRTHLLTNEYGKARRVYEDEDGNLFFRVDHSYHGTYRSYCFADVKDRDDMIDLICHLAASIRNKFNMDTYNECFRLADEYNRCIDDWNLKEPEIMVSDVWNSDDTELIGIAVEDDVFYILDKNSRILK